MDLVFDAGGIPEEDFIKVHQIVWKFSLSS